jgi:hypothetical protein
MWMCSYVNARLVGARPIISPVCGLTDQPLEPEQAECQDTRSGALAVLPYDARPYE